VQVTESGQVPLSDQQSAASLSTTLPVPVATSASPATKQQQIVIIVTNAAGISSQYTAVATLICTPLSSLPGVLTDSLSVLTSSDGTADPPAFFQSAMTAALAVSSADSPLTEADIAAGISTLLSALSAFRNASSDRQWPPSVQSIGAQTVIVQSLLANAPLTTAQTNANMQFLSDIMADVVTLFRSTESSSASAVGSRGSSVDTALFAGFVSAAAIGAGSGAGEAVSSGDAEVLSRSQLSAWTSISTAAIAISVIDGQSLSFNGSGLEFTVQVVSASNLISAPSLVVSSNGSPARVSFSGASVADSLANASTVGMSLVHSVNNILAWQTNLPNGTNSTPLGPSTILKRSVFGDLVGFSLHTDSDPIPLSNVRTPSSSPFSIHVPIPVVQPTAAGNIVLTQCVFWDTVHQVWSSAGCALRNTSTDRVAICDCTHLTMFSVQVCVLCWLRCCHLNSQITEFAPRVRTLSSRDFLNLNWDNIKKHPFSLIACSVFWFLYFVALYLAVRRDRQLLSQLKQRQQQPGDDSTTASAIEMASLSSNTIVDEAQIPLSSQLQRSETHLFVGAGAGSRIRELGVHSATSICGFQ